MNSPQRLTNLNLLMVQEINNKIVLLSYEK